MSSLNRRQVLQGAAALGAATVLNPASSSGAEPLQNASSATPIARKGNIKQSVARWCFQKIPLDDLCKAGVQMGLVGIDLLGADEWDVPPRYGLKCTMGYVDAGTIPKAFNRLENHAAIEAALRKNVPIAAKAGVPNVITFSGNRNGMQDWEGARNTIIGLKRVKSIIEDNGVTLNLELLNSKVNHADYMADHTNWGVTVMGEVGSKNIKLLYDIYHMQIMEGDMIATIQANHEWIGHFHTGGVPGRHELDDTQEINWIGVMRGIVATGYQGYVAHEFLPTRDPLTSLRQAVDLCDV